MILKPKKMAFGRHETFSLRYAWLTKGYREFANKKNRANEEAILSLGVGMNMVKSIRYWMRACQIDLHFTIQKFFMLNKFHI